MAFPRLPRLVAAAVTFQLGIVASAAVVLPFHTDFEADESYAPGPFVSGGVGGAWSVSSPATVEVVTGAFSGAQAVSVLGGQGGLELIADAAAPGFGAPITWVDFYLKPVFTELTPLPAPPLTLEPRAAATGFVKVASSGEVYAFDGNGSGGGVWQASGRATPLSGQQAADWLRISYRVDYGARRWDLFLDGQLVLADLGFLDQAATAFSHFRLRGDANLASRFDYFYAGAENPLYADAANDGLPDSWLVAQGLNPALFQRYADPDHDGVDNLTEFRLGLLAASPDTDGDGLFDRRELFRGSNPNLSATYSLGDVPFADSFETDAFGPLPTGTRLWQVQAGTGAAVEVAAASTTGSPAGAQALRLSGPAVSLQRDFADTARAAIVWVDFHVLALPTAVPPAPIPEDVAAAFYFHPNAQVMALDGAGNGGGAWLALGAASPAWNRLSVRLDYAHQRWSLWLNGVRVGVDLGFARPVPYFSGFALRPGSPGLAGFDGFQVAHAEPAGLDNDGDGLANAAEIALGSNPESADTDGDGLRDQTEQTLGLDPLVAETLITRLAPDGQGGHQWQTHFAASEGYAPGALDGQQGWRAAGDAAVADEQARLATADAATGDATLDRFFGTAAADRVWVSFRARLTPGALPEVASLPAPVSGLFGYRHPGALAVFDAAASDWRYFPVSATAEAWNDYTLFFDYRARRWLLALNGRLVAQDLPFRDTSLAFLHRLRVLQQSAADGRAQTAALDDIVVSNAEPAALDFDGDGLANVAERLAGTDLLNPDTDADGLPDGWEAAHELDPLLAADSSLDPDADGLANTAEYALGSDPRAADGELAGGVFAEIWTGLPGVAVADLTRHADFSTAPDRRALLLGLVSAPAPSPQQGARVRGYLLPAQSGEHVFWLAGDKSAELWLGSDEHPFTRRRLASSPTVTGFQQFTDGAPRQSAPVALVAGRRYYLEILHKADSAAGHFAVSWQPPGSARAVIPGSALARFLPRADDLDGDGLPDAWELASGLDPASAHGASGAHEDPDADGLSTLDEYRAQTAPLAADTDTDGLPDGWELARGLDPLASADAALDLDQDGLSNLQEFQAGTSPASADTDADGLPDAWEVAHGLDALVADARIDTDGDGLSNLAEYVLGTDPATAETTAPAGVLQEEWTEIGGAIPGALTNHFRFSSAAQALTHLAALEQSGATTPASGRRIRGIITAPASGAYTFHVSADDRAELWLSADDTPFRTRRLAFNAESTAYRQFAASGVAVSAPVTLAAGQRYYVEVLHKNDTGSGHFSIAWSRPGQPREIIGAPHLAVFAARADDADSDGLPDAWETAQGLNPTIRHGEQGAYGDRDEDGLRHASEFQAGSNSAAKDTDADGFSDFVEAIAGSAPADPAAHPAALSAPWVVYSVGNVSGVTAVATASGSSLLEAGGSGVSKNAGDDHLAFVALPVATDFEFTARVSLLEGLRAGTAALQLRASAASNSAMVSIEVAGPAAYVLHHRAASGQSVSALVERAVGSHDAHYLRLTRRGDTVRAAQSFDGVHWTSVGEVTFPTDPATPPLVGFTVWNQNNAPAARLFDQLALRADTDRDGFYDEEEAFYGTSPFSTDTDGDGYSDYEEIHYLHSDPATADVQPAQPVVQLAGATGQPAAGEWALAADEIYNVSVRGAVTFEFNLTEAGVHRLAVTARPRANATADIGWDVLASVDGQPVGRLRYTLQLGETGTARLYLPWLPAGAHTVTLYLDNVSLHRTFAFQQVTLERILGADLNNDGVSDWQLARLAAQNTLLNPAFASRTSPFPLEGRAAYLGTLALLIDGQPLAAKPAVADAWYADVPLIPGSPVALEARFENGGRVVAQNLTWTPTNILGGGALVIRRGDALLLEAAPTAATVGGATVEVLQGSAVLDTFEISAGESLSHVFATDGTYTLAATYVVEGSTPVTGTLTVTVIGAVFAPDPVVSLGYFRDWNNPDLPDAVVVEKDARLDVVELTPEAIGARRFRVGVDAAGVRRVAARLPADGAVPGPILDVADIKGVAIASGAQTGIYYVDQYADGTYLVEMRVVVSDIPPDLRVKFEIFVAGVTFEDGTTVKWFTAADFDATGQLRVRFLRAAGVTTSVCHRLYLYQGETLLETRFN